MEVVVTWPDDAELLEFLGVENGPAFQNATTLIDTDNPGVARILFSRAELPSGFESGDTVIASLQFRPGEQAPEGYRPPIVIQGIHIYGVYGELADWYTQVNWQDGDIDVEPLPEEEGEGEISEPEGESRDGEGETVEGEGESRDGEGESIEGEGEPYVPEGEPPEVIPGEMIAIPAGDFDMGRPYTDELSDDEIPVHTVTLDSYEIGKYEVTNQEFVDVLNYANTELRVLTDELGDIYIGGTVYAYDPADCRNNRH